MEERRTSDGKPVATGRSRLSKAAADATEDAYRRNYSGTDVYEMEFSGIRESGEYVVAVEGIDKDNFGNLVKGRGEEVVADAWGGYMDAGDWDRRIQHLVVSRYLLELADMFPERFHHLKLNIPESGSGLPDVVSEALFNLDCYRRMQTADGGVRGGIESSEHPREGEGSWQESLEILAYAPDVWSSHWYAGVAARAAWVLRETRADLSGVYRDSALRAMEFAERHGPELGTPKATEGTYWEDRASVSTDGAKARRPR